MQRMLRPDSEVADMEAPLGPAGRCVDPVFQHSRRHHVGFIRDLVKAGSVGIVETAVEHAGLFFVAKTAGAQRLIIDARVSNRHFLNPPSGPLLTGEGLCHVEFQGAPEDAQNWFVGSADVKNALHQMRILGWSESFFPLRAVLASEVGYTGRAVDQKHLVGLSWTMFFCQDVTEHCTLPGSADAPLFVCDDHSAPPLLGRQHGMGSVGSRWSYADNFGVSGSWRKHN